MKDLYSIELPALGDTSCSMKASSGLIRLKGPPHWLSGALRGARMRCSLLRSRLPAGAAAQCVLRPCCLLPMPCSMPCPRTPSPAAALQTFLLPFDPEDHEDADEWREYSGELSSKELHKVGCVERDRAGFMVSLKFTCCWALHPVHVCANTSFAFACPASCCSRCQAARLQAAIELFPSAGISPLTAETHRQWMGSEPLRVKVGPSWLLAVPRVQSALHPTQERSAVSLHLSSALLQASICGFAIASAGCAVHGQGGAACAVPRPQVRQCAGCLTCLSRLH